MMVFGPRIRGPSPVSGGAMHDKKKSPAFPFPNAYFFRGGRASNDLLCVCVSWVFIQWTVAHCAVLLGCPGETTRIGPRGWEYARGSSIIPRPAACALCVAGLLLGVNVPDHIVGETVDAVAGALGHLGEALGLGLVLESIAGEVDAWGLSVYGVGKVLQCHIPER